MMPLPGSALEMENHARKESVATNIHTYGVNLVLRRPPDPVPDGEGGWLHAPTDDDDPELSQQPVYVGGPAAATKEEITELGELVERIFVLIGMVDDSFGLTAADFQEGDWFEVGGERAVIAFVDRTFGHQVKAIAVLKGD